MIIKKNISLKILLSILLISLTMSNVLMMTNSNKAVIDRKTEYMTSNPGLQSSGIPKTPVISVDNYANNNGSVTLSWNSVPSVDGYKLYRSMTGEFGSLIYNGPNTQYIDSDVPQGTYYYYVQAYNSSGSSPASNVSVFVLNSLENAIYADTFDSETPYTDPSAWTKVTGDPLNYYYLRIEDSKKASVYHPTVHASFGDAQVGLTAEYYKTFTPFEKGGLRFDSYVHASAGYSMDYLLILENSTSDDVLTLKFHYAISDTSYTLYLEGHMSLTIANCPKL